MADEQPALPRSQAVTVLRSLTSIVDTATTVASSVVTNMDVLDGVDPELRRELISLCDAVFDMDYRVTNLHPPSPPGARLPGM